MRSAAALLTPANLNFLYRSPESVQWNLQYVTDILPTPQEMLDAHKIEKRMRKIAVNYGDLIPVSFSTS
jgi:hypothetical protein